MEHMKNFFVEFKSIFSTQDVLKENEHHANIVTATTMFNIYIICIITYILVYFNVFKIGTTIMNTIAIRGFFLLVVPALFCFIIKGKNKWIKNVLFFSFIIMLAMADAILKYNVTLIIVIPVILAARYYTKKFTIAVAACTTIVFCISSYMCVKIGPQDLNSYNLIIPKGTTITVDSTLRDAVDNVDVDEGERVKNIFIHFFLPKFFMYNIVAFACVQISQSGKNMIYRQEEITKKGARIETELDLANNIQKNMLPSIFPPFPEHKEIDIYASMIPAKEVGGDFYDMFLIDDNHLAMVIADVSGKGIPAALFMMISKILIKNVTESSENIENAFNRVNNMLCDGNKIGLFVTAWAGVLDLETGVIEFVNAGHNPPLIYSNRTGTFEFLRTKPNMVLAGIEDTNYKKHEIRIEPEDRIFLYTDGVIEATNSANEMYGEERLSRFLNNSLNLSITDTIKELKNNIDKFVGKAEQFDDITMLGLKYRGKNDNMVVNAEKEFNANMNELNNIQNFVNSKLEEANCDFKTITQVNLVVEEIFTNIAKYAYEDREGTCKLKISFDGNKKVFDFTFEDSGMPFNPLEREDPNITLSAEDRDVGGLGIFIIKKTMDNVEYNYVDGKNVLKIRKIL
ncbi:MAG: SpoIIE family protein phosphatase [Clostridia bacterium]|nr:SpoIIE family protein phosphatase [Clostridia bacterium]